MENTDAASPTNPAVEVAVGSCTEHSYSSHRSSHTSVLLQVVPVTLYGPKGYLKHSRNVGHRKHLQLINVQVGPVNDFGTQFDVNGVLVVDHLNVPEKKMNLQELQQNWPHLSDFKLTEVAGTQVTLLLGSDVAELIVPLEIRHGPKGSPVGVRTRIGWTVTGSVPGYIQEQESVKFMWQLQTRSSMTPQKLGGKQRTLVAVTTMTPNHQLKMEES